MSFVDLAQEGNLPLTQLMDKETLRWTEENKPSFHTTSKPKLSEILKPVEKFLPPKDWFLKQDNIDSIHGIRHIARVMTNATNLAMNRRVDSRLSKNLLIAAALHDLRRKDDKGDEGHSQRAKDWFVENTQKVSKYFNTKLSQEDIVNISEAIYFHEIPYSDMSSKGTDFKHKKIIDLLKTADALDRYRLPKLKWWINDDFLKLVPTDNEKAFAYSLVIKSEKYYLAKKNSIDSIFNISKND